MDEQTANCQVVETDQTHLNQQEHQLLTELLRPGTAITAVIPEDATAAELWTTLSACTHGLALLEMRVLRLKPIIGRVLMIFESKPSLHKSLGYDTYSEFLAKGVFEKLGLHRTSAYQGVLAAKHWPQLGPDQYAKVGPKRLEILSKFATGSSPNAAQWLETAASMTVTNFREYVEQRGFLQPGEALGTTFTIHTNLARAKVFKAFFTDGRIQSVVGSKEWDVVLECMIREFQQEWVDKWEAEEARKQEA
jgi:hypothetical protein